MSHNIGNYIKEIEYDKVSEDFAVIMGLEKPISLYDAWQSWRVRSWI